MLGWLAAFVIVIVCGALCAAYIWLTLPEFPDCRVHPVTLAIRMAFSRCDHTRKARANLADQPALQLIDRKIRALAHKIGAPDGLCPAYRGSEFGHAMIEHDGECYHYLFVERGERYDETVSCDLDEILYLTFNTMTRAMAGEYELIHRDPHRGDIRRLIFCHQLKLLNRLNLGWSQRRRLEIQAILETNPYVDGRLDPND